MFVDCPGCQSRLKVPSAAARRQIRCPVCQVVLRIPTPAPPRQESDTKISDPTTAAARTTRRPASAANSPRKAPPRELDQDLEILETLRVSDPQIDRPRKKKTRKLVRNPEADRGGERQVTDILVWMFLLALLPLVIMLVIPQMSLAERVKKSIENNPDLQQTLTESGPRAVMDADPELRLFGAHLPRHSRIHWLYALITTIVFVSLLTFMLARTTITPLHLVLSGLFTGTVGICMLLGFQIIAQVSLMFGPGMIGFGGIIMLVIRLIAFSYICAMYPGNGFLWSWFGFTCGVGLCEEVCKALPLRWYLKRAEKSDWRGTFLLGIGSGVGFGVSEAIMYAGSYYNGVEPGIAYLVRFASCVGLHGLFSGAVALLMFGNQDFLDSGGDWHVWAWGWLYYIGFSAILHGLYDTLLKQELEWGAVLVAFATFGWVAWLARYYWDYDPT